MKIFQKILSLLCTVVLVTLCNAGNGDFSSFFTGELIKVEPQVSDEADDTETAATETPPIEHVDLSNAILTISYETTSAKGEATTETLYEGPFKGDFEYVLHIDGTAIQFPEPSEIEISLKVSQDSDPMTITTVIETGMDVDFAYIDHPYRSDQFLVVGASNHVLNPDNRFSISGDLNFLEVDSLHTTSVLVYASFINLDGEPQSKQWGPVLVKDGSFIIEGDVERLIQARLYLSGGYNTSTQIVLEPEGKLEVTKLGDQSQAISLTGIGYHEILIDSWQQSEEYIELVEAYVIEYERFHNPSTATDEFDDKSAGGSSAAEADTVEESKGDSNDDSIVAESVKPAEGCEKVVVQKDVAELVEVKNASSPPRWIVLREKIANFQIAKLQDVATNHEDPNAQLLAMQMGAFSPYYEHAKEALSVWRTLSDKFDKDVLDTYVTPELEKAELVYSQTLIDEALVPGQKIPAFTLASLDSEDVSIYDLASEKDMVLIDVWASWCGPCIAAFPELKELYAAYTDKNFEIVGISIDNNLEAWSEGVETHTLPWVQLAELKDTDRSGPVAKSLGATSIPKTFLIDSQGCIYRKDILPAELKAFLIDRYGMDESLEEPGEEPKDTIEAPY
ncbi:MAG: TlpA disulfide reductase family protein [Gammaproteobacteria bacterium]|nr:TlpA disulfide reductase family protein [Gammaproteobacteria bacterium]